MVRTRHPAMYPWLKISTRKDQLEMWLRKWKDPSLQLHICQIPVVTCAVVQERIFLFKYIIFSLSTVIMVQNVVDTKCHCSSNSTWYEGLLLVRIIWTFTAYHCCWMITAKEAKERQKKAEEVESPPYIILTRSRPSWHAEPVAKLQQHILHLGHPDPQLPPSSMPRFEALKQIHHDM